ncbi:MAG: penicillin-binding protein [Lachnospiraceae bacterium]|nr:penicillin-binding protein [Lachnospiraceae bacterium]
MFEKIKERILNIFTNRLTILWIIMAALGIVLVYRCFCLQILEGQEYLDNFVLEQKKTKDIPSTRGNIYDKNGNLLAYNELAYSVKIEDTLESGKNKNAELNSILYTAIKLVEKNGDNVITDFKIYINEDDEFTFTVEGTSLSRFLADIYGHRLITELTPEESTSTPDEVMEYLSRPSGKGYYFAIGAYENPGDRKSPWHAGEGYSKEDWLKLVTLRYAMSLTSYRKYLGTTIATDVSDETVAVILENADILPGISIEEDAHRRYVDSVYFAHILGYTGKASTEDIEVYNQQLLDAGIDSYVYSGSDMVGKSGIEAALETTLQGKKGYETVLVNNTGKVISVLERQESTAGEDVYLSIDKDLTIATYNLVEQKLAGLLVSKIFNGKEYIPAANATSAAIKIPIYDVYYAVINNSIVDMKHFPSEYAGETEKAVYQAYLNYQENAYDKINNELYNARTPYNRLSNEYQVYESNIITLLTKNGVIMSEKVDSSDKTYIAWTIDETISLGEYLEYCISMNWIDTTKLGMDEKYPDSSEIFDALVVKMFTILDNNTDFQKKFFKYMLLNDVISGRQICLLMYEQDACHIEFEDIEALKAGRLTAYQFMVDRITNIDITPAQLALDPCNASVVITDVNSGAILAIVSYPGYDNNMMANTVNAAYYEKLTSDKSSPLLNFSTQYKAAPGSTFKIVSATAGLMENAVSINSQIRCNGTFTSIVPSPKCWNVWGHGNEIVKTAIRDSCNCYFYEIGYRLATTPEGEHNDAYGLGILAEYADLYGLSSKTGIEISEYEPNVSDNDSVRSAIGQGTNSYTTSQLARYVTAIANSGTVYDLTLLDHTERADGVVTWTKEPTIRNTIDIPPDYWDVFHQGMKAVVDNKLYFRDIGVNVAGKTGTAQQSTSRPNHALFICYAPYENPEIAMAVRIPFGYSSDYAAQVARDILKYYYDLVNEEDLLNGRADNPDGGITNEM